MPFLQVSYFIHTCVVYHVSQTTLLLCCSSKHVRYSITWLSSHLYLNLCSYVLYILFCKYCWYYISNLFWLNDKCIIKLYLPKSCDVRIFDDTVYNTNIHLIYLLVWSLTFIFISTFWHTARSCECITLFTYLLYVSDILSNCSITPDRWTVASLVFDECVIIN